MAIPALFQTSDCIAHYTTFQSALNIINTNSLRLSERIKSRDPFENSPFNPMIISDGNTPDHVNQKAAEFYRNLSAFQCCFCSHQYEGLDNGSPIYLSIDDYCFSKPRMWEQYGDKFQGVCLLFSKDRLQEMCMEHSESMRLKKVNYTHSANLRLDVVSPDSYQSVLEMLNDPNSVLIKKHQDYQGENESRIISVDPNDKEVIFHDAMIGIICTDIIPVQMRMLIKNIAKHKHLEYGLLKMKNSELRFTNDIA